MKVDVADMESFRGVWGHVTPENFDVLYSQRCIFLHSEALNGQFESC